MTDQKPTALYAKPLTDLPAHLRALADEIERDGARSCLVLIDWLGAHNDYANDLHVLGPVDPVRVLGMLHLAAAGLAGQMNDGPVARVVERT